MSIFLDTKALFEFESYNAKEAWDDLQEGSHGL
jgi:hypothetical protein